MCYWNNAEAILDDLKLQAVPDEALVRSCCWEPISQVRGRSSGAKNSLVGFGRCDMEGAMSKARVSTRPSESARILTCCGGLECALHI